jgi:hypothetical protein
MIGAKRKTANCGGLSEIRSGVLIRRQNSGFPFLAPRKQT